MKFSKSGIHKARNIAFDLFDNDKTNREFEPEDFTGVIVLTIEEAKHVHNMYLHQYARLTGAGKEFLASLRNRIEQAEK